jgi:uncharacterized protein (DUF1800 family)
MASLSPISGNLGLEKAAHLLRRATFGPTKTEIEDFAAMNVDEALSALMTPLADPDPPIDPLTGSNWLPKPGELNSGDDTLFSYFQAWFIELMRTTGTNLRERMVFFLHAHMPADHLVIQNSTSLYYQNALYRQYAFGSFKELFGKVCVDNAMLKYIDNTLNDKDVPNENFAREMFELYSISKGPLMAAGDYTNYTEADIKEAARVLTGFKCNFEFDTIDADTGLPRGKAADALTEAATRHDAGTKTFSDKFGNTQISPDLTMMVGNEATEEGALDEISQMMDMIFDQEETAKFICRKLYRYFVYYQITDDIENTIIAPLATTLRNNNYELSYVLNQLLKSEHFYDAEADGTTNNDHIGAIIKSPLDLIVGTFRFFEIEMPNPATNLEDLYDFAYGGGILRHLSNQGMKFFKPIDVAGYPPYHQVPAFNRNWISPNWLATRYQFGYQVINGVENEGGTMVYKLDTVAWVENNIAPGDADNPAIIVNKLVQFMFPKPIPNDRINFFLNVIFLGNNNGSHWVEAWDAKIQGDDTMARTMLDDLIGGLMQTPEYQLS